MDSHDRLLTLDDLIMLVQTGRELAEEVSVKRLLTMILERASTLTDSPDASIILYNQKRGSLYFGHAIVANAKMLLQRWGESSEKGIPLKGSKAGQVFRTGKPLIANTVFRDANHFKGVDHDTKRSTESMICVPLNVGGNRLGVVQLLNKQRGDYTDRDLVLLKYFASQAAVAIRNARLFEDLLSHMGFYASRDDRRGPKELIEELNRPARRETMTILFADMRGFAQLCKVVTQPEDTQRLVNDFLAMLAEATIDEGGVVNKFLGDGLMALFRGERHALCAVHSAFRMLDGMNTLRDRWDEETSAPLGFLDLGIGIATDSVIIGTLGSERVREFTAIGIGVILAATLMDQARNGRRILVDKKTFYAVRGHVENYEGPEESEIKKPGQTATHPYECYEIKSLKSRAVLKPAVRRSTAGVAKKARTEIFVSYNHKDEQWLESLQTHLKPYVRGKSIVIWDDTKIKPGDLWREAIERALGSAKVAILLVSPNFLSSDFITSRELPPLLKAAKERGLKILWIPISASSYKVTEISSYQAAIDPSRPLDTMSNAEQNRVWVRVCEKISEAIEE